MKMISEQEKRSRREKAAASRRRQMLEARGYTPQDARQVVGAMSMAHTIAMAAKLAKDMGLSDLSSIKQAEQLAMAEARKALQIVAKHEPTRAAVATRLIDHFRK